MPVIAMPPAPLPALHQLELEQQFLPVHAPMHAPGAMPLYAASGPLPMHASGPMMPMHASGPMSMPLHAPGPTPLYASGAMPMPLHTPMPHAFPSQDVIMGLRNEIAELKSNNTILYASYTTLLYVLIGNTSILTMTDT
jgi:hypothetical protein